MHTPTHSVQSLPEAAGKQTNNGFFLDWADVRLCASVWKKQTRIRPRSTIGSERAGPRRLTGTPSLWDCCTSSGRSAFKLQQRSNVEMTAHLNRCQGKRSGDEAAGRYRALPPFMCSEHRWRHRKPHEKGDGEWLLLPCCVQKVLMTHAEIVSLDGRFHLTCHSFSLAI